MIMINGAYGKIQLTDIYAFVPFLLLDVRKVGKHLL